MLQNHITEQALAVLRNYLAPEAAERAAGEIADATTAGLAHDLAGAMATLTNLIGGADTTPSPPTKRKSAAAPKPTAKAPAKPKKAAKRKAAAPPPGGNRTLSDEARKVMSFKKAVYHATRRAKNKAPKPWDAAILAAHAAGKIISVSRAKQQALASQRKEAAPAAPKKVANGTALGADAPV